MYFYPRPPRGGRQAQYKVGERAFIISIHALREEGDIPTRSYAFLSSISIHALREEGDPVLNSLFPEIQHFYPRPPRGGRHVCNWFNQNAIKFLSTPSARRATSCRSGIQENSLKFLSTPSARRATAEHKPLCGGSTFLSTPSARRATACCQSLTLQLLISIHALREEGDLCSPHLLEILEDFYPRPPRGGRLSVPSNALRLSIFLSTPSARRATLWFCCLRGLPRNFYPRPPRGGRPGPR